MNSLSILIIHGEARRHGGDMASERITFGQLGDVLTRINDYLGRVATSDLLPLLKQWKLLLVSETKKNFQGGHAPDGTPWRPLAFQRARGGDKPLRDRGILMASLTAANGSGHVESMTQTFGESRNASLLFGSNLEYAALHQHGGTIRPRNSKMLAIPLTPEAARAGSPRNFPRDLAVIVNRSTGKGVLVERKRKAPRKRRNQNAFAAATRSAIAGNEIAHYALVLSVTIPARPFLGITPRMIDLLERMAVEFIKRIEGE